MKKLMQTLLVVAGLVLLSGCGQAETEQSEQLQVKTTVYPLTYLVEMIGGDQVEVASILPSGADAHDYEPTQQEIIELGESDLFVYLGIGDQQLVVDELAAVIGQEHVTFTDIAANITPIFGTDSHDHEGESEAEHAQHTDELAADPHIWLDPERMGQMADAVYEALKQALPDATTELQANYERVQTELQVLDADYTKAIAEYANTHMLVTHNAYGYWQERYGVTILALNDLTNNAELTPQEIIAINEAITAEGIRTLFTAPNIESQYTKTFVDQFNLETFDLQNLETLSDAEIATGENYLTIMRANLAALQAGFSRQ